MYKFYNANPMGKFVNDCVVKSISTAEGKSYDETYEELSELAQKERIILDDVNFVDPLLDSRYTRVCMRETTVGEFVGKHPNHIYLITMPNHITCSYFGTIYDSWDCRKEKMRCAWLVE